MRVMMMVKSNQDAEAGMPPTPELMAAIEKLSEEMIRAGKLLSAAGLQPSAQGARIRLSEGKLCVTDGPFAEAKELVGGYAIFEVETKEEGIEPGKQFMALHAEILGPSYEGELEIRPLFDAVEMASGSTPERRNAGEVPHA